MPLSKFDQLTNPVLLLAITSFLIPIILVEYNVFQFTHGVFSYPIDDAFIHLAIGRNLAFYQTWGINPHEFVSAASSLLYPILVAIVIKLFGTHLIIPLLLNVIAGILLLAVLQRWLQRQGIHPAAQFIVLLFVILLTPLPVLTMCGMEHTMQLLFCVLFIFSFSDSVAVLIRTDAKEWRLPRKVYLYGALLTATRYEGIYLIGITCLVLLFHRKVFLSLQLGLLTILPILIFGIFSIYKGSYFFPNSVLLKSGAPPITVDGLTYFFSEDLPFRLSNSIIGYNTIATQRLLFMLPLTYLLFITQIRKAINYRFALIILMAAVILHLSFTGFPNFPRYEAYLIGSSVSIIGALFAKYGKEMFHGGNNYIRWVAAFTALIILFPLCIRSRNAFQAIGQADINIYEQQYQMGQFLHDHYYNTQVAVGDIGAVSFYTVGRKFDLVGLGNLDIARSKRNNYYTADFLDLLSKRDSVKIAICYDYFTDPGLLQRWTKTATWQIPNNVACGDAIVSFYAVDPAAKPDLLKNLRDYQGSLPTDVQVKYY